MSEETSERWYVALTPPGGGKIDWPTQGDRLLSLLRQTLNIDLNESQWVPAGRESEIAQGISYGWQIRSPAIESRLIVAHQADGEYQPLIETDAEPTDESILEPWLSAFNTAYQRLSEQEPERSWWAVIGTYPDKFSTTLRLTEGGTVGGLQVCAADKTYTESRSHLSNPHLGGVEISTSYPIVVRGTSRGYDRQEASQRAAFELNLLCALFSVEFDSYWCIRTSPQEDRGDQIELPTREVFLPVDTEPVLGGEREVQIPTWMDQAMQACKADGALLDAVHAHRQGLILWDDSPSLSLLSFVSAIEGIGATIEPLTTCESCGSHPGAQRRFRLALKTVMTNREMQPLLKAYEFRSQTAHAGTLHGGETTLGISTHFQMFGENDPKLIFRYQTVRQLRKASRQVLINRLSNPPASEQTDAASD